MAKRTLKKLKRRLPSTAAMVLLLMAGGNLPADAIGKDSLSVARNAANMPWLSLQQMLKGNAASIYVQEPSGEPGTKQSMLLRGTSVPLVSATSYYDAQPAVFINGVPVIDDNAFTYNAKNNNVSPLGTASNVLAGIDASNIVAIEVVTDPTRLAALGPLAANGAIMVRTRERFDGKEHVHVDASLSSQLQYNFNATIGNKEKLANYLLTVGTTRNAVALDDASYSKYNIGFNLSLVPFKGMSVNTQILASKSERKRNRYMLERVSEMEYRPSQLTRMDFTPYNIALFDKLLDDSKDDNNNMQLHGYLTVNYKYRKLRAYAGAYFDYITNNRSVFWPSDLMESVNYASDFAGYNRRFYGKAGIGYDLKIAPGHLLKIDWTGTLREDKYHYTYDRGYDGEDDKKQSTNSGGYKQQYAMDQLTFHNIASAFTLNYCWDKYAEINAVIRSDASSAVAKDARWLFTPAVSAKWNIMPTFDIKSDIVNSLSLSASAARIGHQPSTDRYAIGPSYDSNNINFGTGAVIGSYYGFATITRPYNFGWTGYGIGWAYADKAEIGIDASLLHNRLTVGISLYCNNDNNLVTPVSTPKEYGYIWQYRQGMKIENRGIEATVEATPIAKKHWHWTIGVNIAHNENKLKALPDGLTSITCNYRHMEVGKRVDNTIPFLPSLNGGVNSHLTWKRFDMNVGLNFATGQKVLNASNGLKQEALKYILPTSDYENSILADADVLDSKLEDASFLKLRSVSIGYNVPLKKQKLYVYGSAANLFTLTSFGGTDPELVDFDGVYRGYGFKIPRTFTLGCKLSF